MLYNCGVNKSIHSLESIVGSPSALSPIKSVWHMRNEINGKQISTGEVNRLSEYKATHLILDAVPILKRICGKVDNMMSPSNRDGDAIALTHGPVDSIIMLLDIQNTKVPIQI